jgi:hypothetical protein
VSARCNRRGAPRGDEDRDVMAEAQIQVPLVAAIRLRVAEFEGC